MENEANGASASCSNENELKPKRKCKNYTAAEKLDILKEIDKNVLLIIEVARKYGVDTRTIRNWKQQRPKLEELCENNSKLQRKRKRKLPFETLEKALAIWFAEMRLRSIPMNGPLIQAKALELSKEMNIPENFVASEGWFSNWKARHGIHSLIICDEKMSADVEAAEKFKKHLETNIDEDLTLAQIFNADETGLYYKMLPDRTLTETGERQAFGLKKSKHRVTTMVCSNADGSLKLPLVVIGKSAKSREFKNMSKKLLPVYYTHQKSAWLNSHIFENWFKEEFVSTVTTFLRKKKLPLKAILYLDASYQPSIDTLSMNDIEVRYLPPNTTSLIQPMNQGIIENLKKRYRSRLTRCALNAQKNGSDIMTFVKSISLKEVIYWISDAWTSVDSEMIKKCWKQLLPAKFFKYEDGDEEMNVASESDVTEKDILNHMCQLDDYKNIAEDDVRDWIVRDDNCFLPIPSNGEIIQLVTEDNGSESESANEEEDITPQEAISATDTLISFYEKNGLLTPSEFAILRKCKYIAIDLNIK